MRIFRTQSIRASGRMVSAGLFLSILLAPRIALASGDPVVPVAAVYDHADSIDEDDMCYWVHPTDPALSTVIVTDKFAGKIFVYDLAGNLLQTCVSPSPRNVDTRYGVPFGGKCIDVIAFTDRTEDIIRVYRVDRTTRHLSRIDDGQIYTQDNYGFTLYQNAEGNLWGLTGDRDTGLMRQFELFDDGHGQMSGVETAWTFHETRIEGVVADDETGYYYLGEENVGIWRVGVFDHTDKTLIATVGDATGLVGDVEGLALYYAANGEGYLIASSQGANKFTVIDRKPPHQGRGNFEVAGVKFTDGIDVLNMNLGGTYSKGIFTAHNGGGNCCSVQGVRWEDIANALGLVKDTAYWDPRSPCLSDPPQSIQTFEPVADAKVSETTPGGTYGPAPELRVRGGTGGAYHSYLRFDLSGVDAVQSAKLRLYCTDESPVGGLVFPTSTGWSENSITWANKPAATGGQIGSLGPVAANTWVEVDVTAATIGGGPVSFLLTSTSTNSAVYQSGETANPPELVVQVATLVPPVADLSASPLSGIAPLTVAFTDQSTGEPTSWLWSFGDGQTSTATNPQHAYAAPGLYTVSLQVSNAMGTKSTTKTNLVDVQAPNLFRTRLPVADARVSEAAPGGNYGTSPELRVRSAAGGSVSTYLRFDLTDVGAIASAKLRLYCTDGSPVGGLLFPTSNSWTETGIKWSNKPAATGGQIAALGTVGTNVWVEVDVSSAVAGGGPVSFLATSSSSNTALYQSRETATPPELVIELATPTPPVAAFTGAPRSGSTPLTVAFTDQSTGFPTSWSWSFGDGATSTARNPQHVYASTGLYSVTLQVSNALGSSLTTKSNYVDARPRTVRTYLPVADARVNEGSPTTNYGKSLELRVKYEPGSSFQSYLCFDVSDLVGTVTSAKLRLFCTDGSPVGGLFFPTSSGWTETAITWSTLRSPTGGQIASAGAVSTGTWVEVDVTPAVVGPGLVSLLMTSTSSNSALYSSREGTSPELTVTTTGP